MTDQLPPPDPPQEDTLQPSPPPLPAPPLPYATIPLIRKPPVWPSYLITFVLLASQVAIGIFLGILGYAYVATTATGHAERQEAFAALFASTEMRLFLLTLTMSVNTAVVLIALACSRTPKRERIALYPARISWISYAVFALGTIAFSLPFGLLMQFFEVHSPSLESIDQLLQESNHWQTAFSFFLIAIAAPISEELIFRGYIQTRLVERHGPFIGILVASLFFGFLHLDLVQGFFAFMLGIFLGAIAHRTRSIYPAIFCHFAVNAFSVLCADLTIDPARHGGLIFFVCGSILAGALYLLRHTRTPPRPVPAIIPSIPPYPPQ
jgi:membrane protease YdiL (CAAX protease family)